jgi:hypothetical protein
MGASSNQYTQMVSLDDEAVDSSSYVTMNFDEPSTRTHAYATAISYSTIDPNRRSTLAPATDEYQQGNLEL